MGPRHFDGPKTTVSGGFFAVSDCLFCRIVRGEVPSTKLYEDDEIYAFKDINPRAPFHALVVPKRHIAAVSEAAPADAALLGRLMLVSARLAAQAPVDGPRGFRVVVNDGPSAGQMVPHIHFHVLAGRPLVWPPG